MEYKPHNYQKYAMEFILTHPTAALLLDMGLGKTVITLTAIKELMHDRFEVNKVLVIAPLRVARDTWPAEIAKWDHMEGLTYAVAIGTKAERLAALRTKADIHIINRENVQWLVEESGMPFDYDMVVIDELSSFKSHRAKRFRSLLSVRRTVKRIVGLTGTPSSNGLGFFPGAFSSTNPAFPPGNNTRRSGTPSHPGDTNFSATPPLAAAIRTSFCSICFSLGPLAQYLLYRLPSPFFVCSLIKTPNPWAFQTFVLLSQPLKI